MGWLKQVYDTVTDAMLRSMASVESASGLPASKQLSKWQHLLAGRCSQCSHGLQTMRQVCKVAPLSLRGLPET
jgi:hypothetical protein